MDKLSAIFRCRKSMLQLALAALMLAVASGNAHAQDSSPDRFNEEYYRNITYVWTDASGITHTSTLADRADEYEQIVALIKEVYCNPRVPGFVEDPVKWSDPAEPNQEYMAIYKPVADAPYFMSDTPVQTPVEGATVVVIELNDDYAFNMHATSEEMLRKIKSAKVLTTAKHVPFRQTDGSDNPGWLFNFVGQIDKFFLITKGNTRQSITGPFFHMYEEFSPSNEGPIFNAFQQMDSGHVFHVDHNCTSVLAQNHIMGLAPADDARSYPMNLMFFLPDRRFASDSRFHPTTNKKYGYYTYYDKYHQPFFFFNKILAAINEVPEVMPENRIAKVKLEWKSTYKQVTGAVAPEHFYIYRVVDDVIDQTPVSDYTFGPEMSAESTKYEDGSVATSVEKCVVYINEPQLEYGRQVEYIVKGRRADSDFEYVESNMPSVFIPGYESAETLSITIQGTPKSTYDPQRQMNNYENLICLTDIPVSKDRCLTASQLSVRDGDIPGTIFRLMRFTNSVGDAQEVARMEVIGKESLTWGAPEGVWKYLTTITYPEGTDTTGLPLEGHMKSVQHIGRPELDGDERVTAYDNDGGIMAEFFDRFAAETTDGTQPGAYHYYMVYETPAMGRSNVKATSNRVDVTVPVRNLRTGYVAYTAEQIHADTDFDTKLPANPVGVQFEIKSNPSVVKYSILNLTKNVEVMVANRQTTGKVILNRADANAEMHPYAEVEGFQINPIVELESNADPDDLFALVITYNNRNTYGSRQWRLQPAPQPIITSYQLKSVASSENDNTYQSSITWEPSGMDAPDYAPDQAFTLEGWRMWASHDNIQEYLMLHDSVDGEGNIDTPPSQAKGSAPMKNLVSHDYFFDSHEATKETPVSTVHHVRLYARMPEQASLAETAGQPGYLVADKAVYSRLTSQNGIATGIDGIDASAPVTYRYYDLMGRPLSPAALPSGLVIRVGSDGTTTKIVN